MSQNPGYHLQSLPLNTAGAKRFLEEELFLLCSAQQSREAHPLRVTGTPDSLTP